MAIDDTHAAAQRANRADMIEEFRLAKQRQLVRLGTKLWNRTEAQHALMPIEPRPDEIDRSSRSE